MNLHSKTLNLIFQSLPLKLRKDNINTDTVAIKVKTHKHLDSLLKCETKVFDMHDIYID